MLLIDGIKVLGGGQVGLATWTLWSGCGGGDGGSAVGGSGGSGWELVDGSRGEVVGEEAENTRDSVQVTNLRGLKFSDLYITGGSRGNVA